MMNNYPDDEIISYMLLYFLWVCIFLGKADTV